MSNQRRHSYRAILERGEHDPAEPLQQAERIGLKARDCAEAARLAHAVTGARVLEVYRQERGAQ